MSKQLETIHEVVWFVLLVIILGGIGIFMVFRLLQFCTMSESEVKRRLEQHDMVEMHELLFDRRYEGDIMLPQGC